MHEADYKPEKVLKHLLTSLVPWSAFSDTRYWNKCYRCDKVFLKVPLIFCPRCEEILENMNSALLRNFPDDLSGKTCQHCIERGYPNPQVATKQWINGHVTCDDCFEKLSAAITNIPSHFTDYLVNSDDILKHRDDFFNHHHAAVVNLPLEEIHERLEHYKRILFTIRICAEDCQTLIDKAKREARNKQGIEDSKFNATIPTDKTAKSKLKLSKEDKLKQSMAKTLGISVEQLNLLGKNAQRSELATVTGTIVCDKCSKINCTCKIKTVNDEGKKVLTDKIESIPTEKECPYCKKLVPSLIRHFIECPDRPKKT